MTRQAFPGYGLIGLMLAAALALAACGSNAASNGLSSGAPAGGAATIGRLAGEPDPALTPGVVNPDVSQANIADTICKSGWTATIRPPVSYTDSLKTNQIKAYGYLDTSPALYEEDHLISLELGGSPTNPGNLWPEPYTVALPDGRSVGAHVKDQFENRLRSQVCAGTLTLSLAQTEIGDHWVHYALDLPLTPAPSGTVPAASAAEAASLSSGTAAGAIEVAIVSFTSSVKAGSSAAITIQTTGGAACTIEVVYASGPSQAKGLEPKNADDHGQASWTWVVGSSTTPGDRPVTVTCHQGSASGSVDATLAVE